MSDIVERLRRELGPIHGPLFQEAADEIEQLRAENEHLRDLLHRCQVDWIEDEDLAAEVRAALAGKP